MSSALKAIILGHEIPLGTVSHDYANVLVSEVKQEQNNETVELAVRTTSSTIHSM